MIDRDIHKTVCDLVFGSQEPVDQARARVTLEMQTWLLAGGITSGEVLEVTMDPDDPTLAHSKVCVVMAVPMDRIECTLVI